MARLKFDITIAVAGTVMCLAFISVVASAAKTPISGANHSVNPDDPNLAFTPEYASDSAMTCAPTLRGRKRRDCLQRQASVSENTGSPGNSGDAGVAGSLGNLDNL